MTPREREEKLLLDKIQLLKKSWKEINEIIEKLETMNVSFFDDEYRSELRDSYGSLITSLRLDLSELRGE